MSKDFIKTSNLRKKIDYQFIPIPEKLHRLMLDLKKDFCGDYIKVFIHVQRRAHNSALGCIEGQEKIATALGLSVSTVKRAVRFLKSHGVLSIQRTKKTRTAKMIVSHPSCYVDAGSAKTLKKKVEVSPEILEEQSIVSPEIPLKGLHRHFNTPSKEKTCIGKISKSQESHLGLTRTLITRTLTSPTVCGMLEPQQPTHNPKYSRKDLNTGIGQKLDLKIGQSTKEDKIISPTDPISAADIKKASWRMCERIKQILSSTQSEAPKMIDNAIFEEAISIFLQNPGRTIAQVQDAISDSYKYPVFKRPHILTSENFANELCFWVSNSTTEKENFEKKEKEDEIIREKARNILNNAYNDKYEKVNIDEYASLSFEEMVIRKFGKSNGQTLIWHKEKLGNNTNFLQRSMQVNSFIISCREASDPKDFMYNFFLKNQESSGL